MIPARRPCPALSLHPRVGSLARARARSGLRARRRVCGLPFCFAPAWLPASCIAPAARSRAAPAPTRGPSSCCCVCVRSSAGSTVGGPVLTPRFQTFHRSLTTSPGSLRLTCVDHGRPPSRPRGLPSSQTCCTPGPSPRRRGRTGCGRVLAPSGCPTCCLPLFPRRSSVRPPQSPCRCERYAVIQCEDDTGSGGGRGQGGCALSRVGGSPRAASLQPHPPSAPSPPVVPHAGAPSIREHVQYIW